MTADPTPLDLEALKKLAEQSRLRNPDLVDASPEDAARDYPLTVLALIAQLEALSSPNPELASNPGALNVAPPLPVVVSREEVARVIEPDYWHRLDNGVMAATTVGIRGSLEKANAILKLVGQ